MARLAVWQGKGQAWRGPAPLVLVGRGYLDLVPLTREVRSRDAGRRSYACARTMPRSSRNSTGSCFLPCSHISEKNQMPLSPIQKSAGVNSIFESAGFFRRSGVYSAGQPNNSPCQYLPMAWRCRANALTSCRSGICSGKTGAESACRGMMALLPPIRTRRQQASRI